MWWLLPDLSGTVVEFVQPVDPAAVAVAFEWEVGLAGEDALVVTPPEGMFCEPADCRVVVPEMQAGSVLLFDYVGY